MIEIIPNIHPLLVHFSVAIIVLSGLMQLVLWMSKSSAGNASIITTQKWLISLGAIFVVATVLSGLNAASTVNHDTLSHLAMLDHRNWALPTAGIYLFGTAIFYLLPTKRSSLAGIIFIISLVLVTITAFKGGELVYRHGLGVMSLPEVTGDGHDHEHANESVDVEKVEQTSATIESKEHDNSDGHSHDTDSAQSEETVTLFSGLDNNAAKTVIAFHEAINSGNADKVRLLLDDAVLIFEGGGVERSAEEYAGHHLKADIAFLMNMKVTAIEHQVQGSADMAISMSRSQLVGKHHDKDIDITTMETIALRKTNEQWRIIHIHWSN